MRQDERERHQLGGFVRSISKHDTLITSPMVFETSVIQTLGNVGGLLFDGNEHVAGLVIESLIGMIVSDPLDGITNNFLKIDGGSSGDFTKDHNLEIAEE
jgi:hypothetical protein